ncbi:protein FAM200C-like [Parasteatoda tepidariorum]|uniref:protein FAM200C-like n=1 Tax=Parasteatoda tepidariorum TaxID=114398 RepID=UPI0039BCC414
MIVKNLKKIQVQDRFRHTFWYRKQKSDHSVPLSNNTVSRRIDEMAADVESKLIKFLKEGKFALQIDESTVIDNKAVLVYVRFINESKEINEEMLFTRTLNTDTKGSSIFKLVKDYFEEKEIPLTNVSACSTDGAPTMSGCHTGFLGHLKKEVPEVISLFIMSFIVNFRLRKIGYFRHQ